MRIQVDYIIIFLLAAGFISFILYAMKNSRENTKKEEERKKSENK